MIGGHGCIAAKFNMPQSLHQKVSADETTGSWLVAAGTVIDSEHASADGDLKRLLLDYIAKGSSLLKRLDGVFALAIYNGLSRTLAVVSDPLGFFSVFYGERGDCAFIGTSALAVAQQVHAKPSDLGIQSFLRTGRVMGDMTLWQEVKRLLPATVLELGTDGAHTSTYWVPSVDTAIEKLSLPEAVDASAQFLPAVLKRNLGARGKVWSDLTGGFDTRFMVVLLERAGLPFKANFVGPDDHPDVQIAKQIIQRTGWEHQHYELPPSWAQDAPNYLEQALYLGDGHLNLLLMLRPLWVHQQERQQYSLLLSGLGGEMWRAINWWSERAAIGRSNTVHYERQLWSMMHPIPKRSFVSSSRQRVHDELVRQFQAVGERCPDAPNTFKLDLVWTFRETGHAGAWTSCGASLLRIMPALFSKDIVNYVMSLDYRWRVNNSLLKHMLLKYRPELGELEVEGRGPAVPLRYDNWYRFVPSRLALARKAIDKFSQVAFQTDSVPECTTGELSRLDWRRSILDYLSHRGSLDPAQMQRMHCMYQNK